MSLLRFLQGWFIANPLASQSPTSAAAPSSPGTTPSPKQTEFHEGKPSAQVVKGDAESIDRIINLQVGSVCFTTLASTLTAGSPFLAEWYASQAPSHILSPDGSEAEDTDFENLDNTVFFLDADPNLFSHILHYLRRGTLPLLYTARDGFDYALYRALQAEAEYLGVFALAEWIKAKKYERMVSITYNCYLQNIFFGGPDGHRGTRITEDATVERTYHVLGVEKAEQTPAPGRDPWVQQSWGLCEVFQTTAAYKTELGWPGHSPLSFEVCNSLISTPLLFGAKCSNVLSPSNHVV